MAGDWWAANTPTRFFHHHRERSEMTAPQLEELIKAALLASPEQKAAALCVLQGTVEKKGGINQEKAREPYMTLRQVGKIIGVSPCTLWRWRIPGQDLGGRTRYRLSEVLTYLESEQFKRHPAALRAERKRSRMADQRKITGEGGTR